MCLVAAAIFTGLGYHEAHNVYLLKHRGVVVSATVLDESGGKSPHISVRYLTRAGETVTGDTSNYLDADRGDTIQVVYDPKDPSRMQAADWGFDYLFPVVLAIVAAVFLLVGILGVLP